MRSADSGVTELASGSRTWSRIEATVMDIRLIISDCDRLRQGICTRNPR
jgi:hypothetical protein